MINDKSADTDIFREYLEDGKSEVRGRALTATSYKNFDHTICDADTGLALATLGDALYKCALSEILFDKNKDNITERKKKYESDKSLVKYIAAHYGVLQYIRRDKEDEKIPKDYEYSSDSHKYIATAMEALLAAFYLDYKRDYSLVLEIAKRWMNIIDEKTGK